MSGGAVIALREALLALRAGCPNCRTPEQSPPYGYACHHHRWLFSRSRELIDGDKQAFNSLRRAVRALLEQCDDDAAKSRLADALAHIDALTANTSLRDAEGVRDT